MSRDGVLVGQASVKWMGYASDEATWLDVVEVQP